MRINVDTRITNDAGVRSCESYALRAAGELVCSLLHVKTSDHVSAVMNGTIAVAPLPRRLPIVDLLNLHAAILII